MREALTNRYRDRQRKKPVFYQVRYADDFVILCSAEEPQVLQEKQELAKLLEKELGLTLSVEKTKVTRLQDGFDFLGHHILLGWNARWGWVFQARVPPDRQSRMRHKVKRMTNMATNRWTVEGLIKTMNPLIRGWGNFYQHATGVGHVFREMDNFIYERIFLWLQKKFSKSSRRYLYRRYHRRGGPRNWLSWTDGDQRCAKLSELPRGKWNLQKRQVPCFMRTIGEPGA